mgnify:FL=1|tara:strand:+ start:863 stop:1255 length:393 start_codon:yes stop_codon:yes gene_type:complete
MNPNLKNILVFFAGCILGMCINMGLIITGNLLIPLADGVNPMDATMSELKYFLFPFLAHAIGTLSGAFIAARYAASYHMILAICIGIFFLLGGISMVFIISAPLWFIIVDISIAYIPMGWLGWKLTGQDK